ncbi:MAG: type II toxin-antitoxin system prevent-host-death family antitoxin [Acidimicrobiia bacterium]|nr:type II toxin-antitoxin system prevent-host-death family antitoxin [Acidimicrobiia bacterium]
MSNHEVTIRELRNQGGKVIDRVFAGEHLTVTRSGKPVAELRPIPGPALNSRELLRRWSHLPHVDPERLREDVDRIADSSL